MSDLRLEDLKPCEDQLIVELYEKPEATAMGIIIPEAYRPDFTKQYYWVRDVGPGCRTRKGYRVPMECAIDDLVCADPFAVKPIDNTSDKYYIVRERDISHKVLYEEWDIEQGDIDGEPPNADAEPDPWMP